MKEYQKTKYDNNPLHKLRMCIGSRIRKALKNQSQIKEQQTIEYLGCDYEFLKIYLENQFQPNMTWENYGECEIDHIIPVSKNGSFHYSNLQPLWKIDNRKKSNKL
jgi:5-methylcytosine-specific restriction endonuclease McrA